LHIVPYVTDAKTVLLTATTDNADYIHLNGV